MHDVEVISIDQFLRRRDRPSRQQPGGRGRRRPRVAVSNSNQGAARRAYRPRVDLADEPGTDDSGSRTICHGHLLWSAKTEPHFI
jgi:hypothetical protein